MTKQESLRILDQCIAYLDSLSDEEIDRLADKANEYMSRPIDCSEADMGFEVMLPVSEEVHNMRLGMNDSKKIRVDYRMGTDHQLPAGKMFFAA